MSSPQDIILANLGDIADVCDGVSTGTITEQNELREAITYIRHLYNRTIDQHQEIQDYCHQLGLPTVVQRLSQEPFDVTITKLQTVSSACGVQGVLSAEWGDWVRQSIEYIDNLRQTISDWQRIIKQLDDQLRDGTH